MSIVSALSQQPPIQTMKNLGRRRKTTQPVLTRGFYTQAQTWSCCLRPVSEPTHFSLSHFFCWYRSYLSSMYCWKWHHNPKICWLLSSC